MTLQVGETTPRCRSWPTQPTARPLPGARHARERRSERAGARRRRRPAASWPRASARRKLRAVYRGRSKRLPRCRHRPAVPRREDPIRSAATRHELRRYDRGTSRGVGRSARISGLRGRTAARRELGAQPSCKGTSALATLRSPRMPYGPVRLVYQLMIEARSPGGGSRATISVDVPVGNRDREKTTPVARRASTNTPSESKEGRKTSWHFQTNAIVT